MRVVSIFLSNPQINLFLISSHSSLQPCCIHSDAHLRWKKKGLRYITDTYSQQKNLDIINPGDKDLNGRCDGLLNLQLHDEVQVVRTLVDILQRHDILMLYPAEGGQRNAHCSCQPLFISAQSINEVQLDFSFVKMMPCQPKTNILLLFVRSTLSVITLRVFAHVLKTKCSIHPGEKAFVCDGEQGEGRGGEARRGVEGFYMHACYMTHEAATPVSRST